MNNQKDLSLSKDSNSSTHSKTPSNESQDGDQLKDRFSKSSSAIKLLDLRNMVNDARLKVNNDSPRNNSPILSPSTRLDSHNNVGSPLRKKKNYKRNKTSLFPVGNKTGMILCSFLNRFHAFNRFSSNISCVNLGSTSFSSKCSG